MRNYKDMSLFELMNALKLAAVKNSAEDVKAIANVANALISKCDASQLAAGLSEKIIDGAHAGVTGLHCLMSALSRAASTNSEENVKAISTIAKTVIDKCDAQQLSVGLSEKRIGGDRAGATGLYTLMVALSWAALKDSKENVKAISALAKTVSDKCDAQQLSIGLSEKITGDVNAGMTGLHFLMRALLWAASTNSEENVEAISAIAKTVIDKYDAQQLSIGLSEQITFSTETGATGLNYLMRALNNAADTNSEENVKAISAIAKIVINKCDAQQLSAGLAEKINGDGYWGETGLYSLMNALHNASSNNSAENVKTISDIAKMVIDKCDAQQLSVGLSEKITGNVNTGATGLYCLMHALNNAASKNSEENVKAIADVAKMVINKCDAQQLSVGLSEKRIGGNTAGETGLHYLMLALSNAAFKNSAENVKAISDIAKTVIEKCDAQQLSVGLSEKIINGNAAGETGLSYLMRALNNAADKKSQENIKIIADLIIQMSTQLDSNQIPDYQKKLIFSGKKNLSEPLKEYLKNKAQTMPIKEFEKMCSSQKMLGALIDHHRGISGEGETATRVFVNELLKENKERQEVIAQTILEKFLRGEIVLPDADSLTAIVQKEVTKQLGPEKSKDENAVHQLALAVLRTDIIQKQLLPEREDKREEFLKNIAQAILNKFLNKKIPPPDADSLTAIVQKEVIKQLGSEKSKDENVVHQLSLAVLRTDIIQKQLLPERARREKKAGQFSALSQGPGLFAGPSAEKRFRTVAVIEVDEHMVSRKAPAIHVPPSDNALRYAEIFHREAIKLYSEHKNRFHEIKNEIEKLQLWKNLLNPNEMEAVKEAARSEWNKLMSKNVDQKTALEIDRLLSTVVVPMGKITPSASESDVKEEVREKPKSLSS